MRSTAVDGKLHTYFSFFLVLGLILSLVGLSQYKNFLFKAKVADMK